MAGSVSDNFILLLRNELCGEGTDGLFEGLRGASGKDLSEIVALAKRHDLLPLVAHSLSSLGRTSGNKTDSNRDAVCAVKKENSASAKDGNASNQAYGYGGSAVSFSLPSDTVKKLHAVYLKSVGVCEKQLFEISSIRSALENAHIRFIFLKGAVMRGLYPESWMRTSSDIDVLVHEGDLDGAVAVLTDLLGYSCAVKGTHDVQLIAPSGVHVELHFRLIEEYRYPRANEYLNAVWDQSHPKSDASFEYVLSDEMFIFYHVAHTVKHFETGGCGVRFFCDLYFINKHFGTPSAALCDMLTKAGFLQFYETASLLALRWFDGISAPELDEFADFILSLGTFGSRENLVAVRQSKRGGRFKYLLHRAFMPYDMLTVNYPTLKGRKYLTPLYEMRRWFDIISGGRASKAGKEIGASLASDVSEREKMLRVMSLTGLK